MINDNIIDKRIEKYGYKDQYGQIEISSKQINNLFKTKEEREETKRFINSDKSKYMLSTYTNGCFIYKALCLK